MTSCCDCASTTARGRARNVVRPSDSYGVSAPGRVSTRSAVNRRVNSVTSDCGCMSCNHYKLTTFAAFGSFAAFDRRKAKPELS
jgi:hypothetical protein